jgi:hypothetical protein
MIGKVDGGVAIMLSEDSSCLEMFITGRGKMHGKAFSENPIEATHISLTVLDGKIFVRETLVEKKEKA